MNTGEWTEAFDYLLKRLITTQVNSSLITEIQSASTLRIEDTTPVKPEIMERRRKMRLSNGDFEARTFRALTSREVFFAALQILITRLQEVPALSMRLQELLNKRPSEIQWAQDATETEYKAPQENFTAESITLSTNEMESIKAVLSIIENLYENE